ncbi:MAG: ABC transporter permease [Acidimicrobiales bacterium]
MPTNGTGRSGLPRFMRSVGFIAVAASVAVIVVGQGIDAPIALVILAVLVVMTVAAAQISRRYVAFRLLSLVPVMLAVTFLSFIMLSFLPGDPAVNILGNAATPEAIEEFREDNRLDDPVVSRYFRWLGDATRGDLGDSPFLGESVVDGLGRTLPISLQYMIYTQIFALVIAIPLGIFTAYKAGQRSDNIITTTSFGVLAIPNFVLGLVLVFFFALGGFSLWGRDWGMEVLPAIGYVPFGESVIEHFKRWILPVVALGAGQAVVYMRLLRTDMIATLQEEYINVAKAKGMSTMRILLVHALRPSSFTLLTVAGVNLGALVGGSLILETIFNIPGVGSYLATAIFQRDWLVVQGVVVVLSVGFVFANFAVDIIYAILDPRIRHARAIT